MPSLSKATHMDRDDFDADHYADCIRDAHRSRLTLDQLDIAQRQLRRKEKFLTRIHDLKMKEHNRIKNDFIKKIEQDSRISNLPNVRETLKSERRKHSPSILLNSTENSQEKTSQQLNKHLKISIKPDSPRTERLKHNLEKFKHTNTLLD